MLLVVLLVIWRQELEEGCPHDLPGKWRTTQLPPFVINLRCNSTCPSNTLLVIWFNKHID